MPRSSVHPAKPLFLDISSKGSAMSFLKTLLSLFTCGNQADRLPSVSFKEALAAKPYPILLDVRTASEFKSGAIKGARNLDVTSSGFAKGIESLAKDKTYLLYCRSSHRSGMALAQMKAKGFADVRHLAGGISAWQAAGYPVTR